METPLFLRLFGLNILHHNLKPQTHVSYSMSTSTYHFTVRIPIFLFLRLHCKKIQKDAYIKMRDVTTRRIKKSATVTTGLHLLKKIGQYSANPISRI
jgi:hypothetical protein